MTVAAPSQPSAQLTLRLSETARAMNAPTQRKAPTMKPRCTVGQYQRGRAAIIRSTCSVPYSFVRLPKPIPAATETTAPSIAHCSNPQDCPFACNLPLVLHENYFLPLRLMYGCSTASPRE